jgi:predicted negative regulator of RcsB-dependent stress response
MSKQIDKQELKGPDAFVFTTEKALQWVKHNFAVMSILVIAAIVVSLGWLGYDYYDSSREERATGAIYKAESELKSAESKVRDERAKMMGEVAAGKKGVKPELVRPADYVKDFAPAVEKVKEQIKAHSSTKAALISALSLSSFLMQQKQYTEALNILDIPTYKPSSHETLGGFWLMQRGITYLENQKTDQAIDAYQNVLSSPDLKIFQPEAMLKLGVALELKGDKAKARETYERLGREFPNTEASTSAQQYLRLLELNQAKQG